MMPDEKIQDEKIVKTNDSNQNVCDTQPYFNQEYLGALLFITLAQTLIGFGFWELLRMPFGAFLDAWVPGGLYVFGYGVNDVIADYTLLLFDCLPICGLLFQNAMDPTLLDKGNASSATILTYFGVRLAGGSLFFLTRAVSFLALLAAHMTGLGWLSYTLPCVWTVVASLGAGYWHYTSNILPGATVGDSIFFTFEMAVFSFLGLYGRGWDAAQPFARSALAENSFVCKIIPGLADNKATLGVICGQITTRASHIYIFSRSLFPELTVNSTEPLIQPQGKNYYKSA